MKIVIILCLNFIFFIPIWAEAPLSDYSALPVFSSSPGIFESSRNDPFSNQDLRLRSPAQRIHPHIAQKKPVPQKPSVWPKTLLGMWLAAGAAGSIYLYSEGPLQDHHPQLKKRLPLLVLAYGMVLTFLWVNLSQQQTGLTNQLKNGGNRMLQISVETVISTCTHIFSESLRKSIMG